MGNKADLLPKSIKKNKLIHWMKREAKELGLKSVDVFLMSAQKDKEFEKLPKPLNIIAKVKMYMLWDVQTLVNQHLLMPLLKK